MPSLDQNWLQSSLDMAQDFSGQNLRGRSFKGEDLTGANFSDADIRGTNFSNATLIGANFSHAKAGLQYRWIIVLVIGSLLVGALTGAVSGTSGVFASSALSQDFIKDYTVVPTIIICLIVGFFFVSAIRYGLTVAFINLGWTLSLAWILVWVGARDKAADWTLALALALGWVWALAGSGALAEACVGSWAWIWTLAGVLSWGISGVIAGKLTQVEFWILAVITAWTLTLLGAYFARRGFAGDPGFKFVRSVTLVFGAIGGTSFQGANLTDANFAHATLKSTDLRNAVLIRTCWSKAKKLECTRVGKSYLKHPEVRQLVVTGDGRNQNFDDLSLQGINLQEAKLADVSFIRSNLNQANLQGADLSRAKLIQTQLDGADLTGACLTGAFIEDWGITVDTKLDGVECQYVYMRLPTRENPDPYRKPDNHQEFFEPGDFADFIQPIVDTLDLYHNQGVDPRAIAISFKQLAENNPEAGLEIVAMEKRGRDKFLLRAKVAEGVNRSQLSAEYFSTYNQLKALPENHMRLLLAEKDNRIQQLENMVMTALKRPSFYAENYHNQGDTMSEKGSNIKIGDVSGGIGAFAGGNVSGVAGQNMTGVAGGDISGTVTNTIGELQESEAPEAPQLAELLKQLQEVIEKDPDLSEEDKAEALEQVKTLAEAGKNPQEGTTPKAAKTAMKILKGTAANLPSAAALVEACNKLLPMIASLLGLA